jgi:hypothetical protein
MIEAARRNTRRPRQRASIEANPVADRPCPIAFDGARLSDCAVAFWVTAEKGNLEAFTRAELAPSGVRGKLVLVPARHERDIVLGPSVEIDAIASSMNVTS